MAKKLHVGNLSFDTTKEQLEELFGQAGEITEITMMNDRDSGRPRGFAFVEMATETQARDAITRFNGSTLDEREIAVSEARPREQRPSPPRGFDRDRRRRN